MKKIEVIEGLKCLIEDRKSFLSDDDDEIFLEDIKVLKEAIKLIIEKKVEFDLANTGCPMCENDSFICLSTDLYFETLECNSCNSQIKVKVIKKIKEVNLCEKN